MDEITTFPQPINRLRLEELNTILSDEKKAPQAGRGAGGLAETRKPLEIKLFQKN